MLKRRIIPFLLIDKNYDCVKTSNFQGRKYIGDIFNNIRIFNEKGVDEIVVLDIDATENNQKPNFKLIEKIASVCRMPITYGGGVLNVEVAKKIIGFGVEKICLNNAALNNIDLVKDISREIGSQSLSISINIMKSEGGFNIVNNKKILVDINLNDYIEKIQKNGAGEIILSSVKDDGSMNGYDLDILESCLKFIKVPSILLGGCSGYDDIKKLFNSYKSIAAGASSIFIFKGKLKAVLISYPSDNERDEIINNL
tara:strand:+ start:118 stop:882 length:765 start_codon:yes stop_codon:yes gene_type:complete